MTRHRNQQRVGMVAEDGLMGVADELCFALPDTGSHPDRAICPDSGPEPQSRCDLVRIDGLIELEIASGVNGEVWDRHVVRSIFHQTLETSSVVRRLRTKTCQPTQRVTNQ
jgi:hypothetical protein